jgi:RNA recognition motif-containing protein
MNIYVGNINYEIGDDDLKQIFEEFGEVKSVKIIKDNFTGRSKGFGFVEMADEAQAKKAIEDLNEAELMGKKIVVNQARPKTEGGGSRGGSRGGYGGGGHRSGGGGGERGGYSGGGNRRNSY